ncbi:hypothetical protein BH09SUM1_BH09SUM1_30820 [soil metagenome]
MSTAESPRKPARFFWPAQVILIFVLIATAFVAWANLAAPFDAGSHSLVLDREEGFIVNQAIELHEGRTIYPELKDYPYTVGNYTPLFPFILSPFVDDRIWAFPAGRILCGFSLCGILIAIGILTAWHPTAFWGLEIIPAALLGLALFTSTYDVSIWLPLIRVDLPAIFFGSLGLVVAIRGTGRWQAFVAPVFFTAAFFTKQTQVIAPMAAVIALWVTGRRRDSVTIASITGGAIAGIVAIICIVTHGQFWKHVVTYNANAFDWWQLPKAWLPHIARFELFKILAAITAVAGAFAANRENADRQERTMLAGAAAYLALSALSIIQIAKRGSAPNYLLEFDLAVAMAVSLSLVILIARHRRTGRGAFALAVPCVLLLLHVAQLFMPLPPWGIASRNLMGVRYNNVGDQGGILGVLALPGGAISLKGTMLCEIPFLPIALHQPVLYQPFIMTELAREGKWDQTPFVNDIRAGKFPLIITTQDVEHDELIVGWTPEMKRAIVARYQLYTTIPAELGGNYYVYRLPDNL